MTFLYIACVNKKTWFFGLLRLYLFLRSNNEAAMTHSGTSSRKSFSNGSGINFFQKHDNNSNNNLIVIM